MTEDSWHVNLMVIVVVLVMVAGAGLLWSMVVEDQARARAIIEVDRALESKCRGLGGRPVFTQSTFICLSPSAEITL